MAERIVIEKFIDAPRERVYDAFINPGSLKGWYSASPDWMTPYAEVEATPGGALHIGFRHKTEGHEFDFAGTFKALRPPEYIAYTLSDGREVEISLYDENGGTTIVESFDPETMSTRDQQTAGWTALLDSLERFLQTASHDRQP